MTALATLATLANCEAELLVQRRIVSELYDKAARALLAAKLGDCRDDEQYRESRLDTVRDALAYIDRVLAHVRAKRLALVN